MVSRTAIDQISTPIVPIDGETQAILDYAASAETQARFAQARREVQEGHGVEPNPEYFVDLNRRIAQRAEKNDSNKEA